LNKEKAPHHKMQGFFFVHFTHIQAPMQKASGHLQTGMTLFY